MDSDVALLNQYASQLTALAPNADVIAANAAVLQGAYLSEASVFVSLASAIGSGAKVNLYAAMLSQAASDLQGLISGSVIPQDGGDVSMLNAMATWGAGIASKATEANNAIIGLAHIVQTSTVSDAISQINVDMPLLNPFTNAQSDFSRIAQRMQAMLDAHATTSSSSGSSSGSSGSSSSDSGLKKQTSSTAGYVIGGLALATVAAYVVTNKKHGRSRRG